MLFKRELYLQKLKESQGNGMIKIITGIRRCGKSFLLFELFYRYLREQGVADNQIIRIDLENRRNQDLRDPDNLLHYIDSNIIDQQHYFVFIDEIQLVPEFEDVLNSYLKMTNVDVYVTGSNSRFLSTDVITEFRGRGWEIRVHPLSFAEYYEAVGGDEQRTLNDYYLYGGLPAVALMDSDQQKQDYLTEVFETVYLKDVLQRNHLRKVNGLRELVRILASSIGSGLNVKKIANTFKSESNMDVSPITIASYLEHLQDAFIVNEAMRYDVKGRKYIGTETKYYFEDVGVRNAIIGFRQIEMNHSMENVIYNELRHLGYTVDVGMVEVMKRDAERKQYRTRLEVDFVVNRHDQRLYIQSAYRIPDKEKMEQEQASLLHIPDAFRKIIIDGDRYTSNYNNNGVLMIGVCDFLMHPEKISS